MAIAGDTNNGYTRGNVFSYGFDGFAQLPTLDYTFRTYTSVSAVPEPETYAMLLAGLGVPGFVGKRRKAG